MEERRRNERERERGREEKRKWVEEEKGESNIRNSFLDEIHKMYTHTHTPW